MSTESEVEVHESTRAVGDYLGIERRVGDELTVECSNGSFSGEVYEVPDDVPTEKNQTKEVLVTVEESEDIVGLYCHVMEMGEMRVRYDVYGVRMAKNGEDTNLGEIQRLEVR